MVQGEAKSKVPSGAQTDDCRRRRTLVEAARSCLAWHSGRMKDDGEYRAAVQYVTRQLAERPGRLGQAVRHVVSTHALLVKVL